MANWKQVTGESGRTIRWNEVAKDEKQAEKTVYLGKMIEGVYKSKKDGVGENNSTIYLINTEKDGLLSVWSTTVLAERMNEVPVGSLVQIECLGLTKAKSGGKSYNTFDVRYDDAPRFKETGANAAEGIDEM